MPRWAPILWLVMPDGARQVRGARLSLRQVERWSHASLRAALTRTWRDRALSGLARRRVVIDRDRKTKARHFPPAGPRLPTRNAPAEISLCGPIAA
jgi:hypothetical protein